LLFISGNKKLSISVSNVTVNFVLNIPRKLEIKKKKKIGLTETLELCAKNLTKKNVNIKTVLSSKKYNNIS